MSVAVEANVRTAVACRKGVAAGFAVAFKAGSVMGLAMVGVAVFGLSLLYLLWKDVEVIGRVKRADGGASRSDCVPG
jgi:K(+)-stimulated pyrophosphate-energized sodium pump